MDIQYYILGVLAFSQKPNKNDSYPLPPIDFWTTEFCNTLNEMEFGKNKFVLSASDKGLAECCSDEVKKIFKHFPDAYKVDSIYIRKLPDCNFVHLNRTVILSEDSEKCAKECANCIREGLGLLKTFEEQMEALKCKSSECATIEDCETIAKCCALSAQVNLDNKRSVTGSDHDCWNELLQNVDDHIAEDGKLHITLNRDSLTLSYMERGVGGFTAKDFVAVCTLGNSGNVSAGQEDQGNPSATGHKGTGFKSVYNYFEKVTIESGNIKCILDDTVKYDYSNCITDKEVDLSKRGQGIKYGTSVEKKRFPVPEFEALPHKAAATTITFTFKNGGDGYDKLLEQIGLKENIPEKYYFLKHIKKIIYNETSLIALDDIRKNQFYFREECFEVTKDLLNKNPRWEKTSVDDFKKSEKNKVQFLFPKEKLPESTNVFCTLPVCGESLDIPFYINCPALELEDSRNKIQGQSVKDWNDEIKKLAYSGQDSCFHRSFTKFAEDPQNIAIAYKYFPYNYIGNWKNIESIPFLQTTDDGNSMYLMSLEQWYVKLPEGHQTMLPDERKNGFVILPQYMYDWFEHKGDLDGYQTSVPFLYYPDMKEWFAEGTGFLNRLCNIYKYTQDTVFDTLRQLFQSNQNCVGSVVVDIINK